MYREIQARPLWVRISFFLIIAVSCIQTSEVKAVPGMPSSITVPATSDSGSYVVSWGNATDEVTRYELLESYGKSTVLAYSGTALSVAMSGKMNGTYSYAVRACDTTGCSQYLNAANPIQVTMSPPNIPSSIVLSTYNNSSFTVSWGASTGVMSAYELYESTNPVHFNEPFRIWCTRSIPPECTATLMYKGLDLSTKITGKKDGTYYYAVRACNGSTCSGFKIVQNPAVVVNPKPLSSLKDGTTMEVPAYARAIKNFVGAYHYYEKPNPSNTNCVIDHARDGIWIWWPFDPNPFFLGRFGYRSSNTNMGSCALPDCVFTDFLLITQQIQSCPAPTPGYPDESYMITVFPGELKNINGQMWGILPVDPPNFPFTAWHVITPPGKPLGSPGSTAPYIQSNFFDELVYAGGGNGPANGHPINGNPRAAWVSLNGRTVIYLTGLATSGNVAQDADDYFSVTDGLTGNLQGFYPALAAVAQFITTHRENSPTVPIDIVGHSLGCTEATLLYDIWYFKSGEQVICLSPPWQIPINRMLANNSGAQYVAYGGINDPINGRKAKNDERRANGVNIIDANTGSEFNNPHDRCKYQQIVFGECRF